MLLSTFGAATSAESVSAVVKTVDPDILTGRIVSLSLNDGLLLDVGGGERRIGAADLVRMTLASGDDERGRRDTVIRLRNGDVIHGRIKDSVEGAVTIEASGMGEVNLTLEALWHIDMPQAFESGHADAVRWFDRGDKTREDRVLLTNGDVLRGFVTGIRDDLLSIDGALGEVEVASRLVVAVRFAVQSEAVASGARCAITFRDGSRMTACSVNWEGAKLSARWCGGPTLHIMVDRVARIDFAGGRWEWLSDQSPISFEHTPMLSLAWELQKNRNVLSGPITVANESYERGIGVHSRCSLIYDLAGAYTGLETFFAIDDDSGALADVDVVIRVDGQPRYRLDHVRRGTLQGPVRLDLRGAKRIELLVDYGANGDIQDRFDWVEPALIR